LGRIRFFSGQERWCRAGPFRCSDELNSEVRIILEMVRVEQDKYCDEARRLFEEYGESTNIRSSHQEFDEELAHLPHPYVPPEGCLLLALYQGQVAGCVALRNLGQGICEMKRLYVKPKFRDKKVGKALTEAIIEEAERLGYRLMRLDTLTSMVRAQRLYESLGFQRIAPYFYKPDEETVFMELTLPGRGGG